MKITLSLVRQVLKDALGFESFVAGFVRRIEKDEECPSAAISAEGTMFYNPRFCCEHVTCKEDLFSLVMHEVLHAVFGHFIYRGGPIENIAADAIINATISRGFAYHSNGGTLFRKLYAAEGLEGLLRPESRMAESRYDKVYRALYQTYGRGEAMTTGELIQTLKILDPGHGVRVLLLGSHPQVDQGQNDQRRAGPRAVAFPVEVLERMARELRGSLSRCRAAGQYQTLMNMVIEVLKSRLSLRRALLEQYATRRRVGLFLQASTSPERSASPVPVYPSKRDLVLVAAGVYPGHFHNRKFKPRRAERGAAVYLDVSGSVHEHLPRIVGLVARLRGRVKSIYLFSNRVVETSLQALSEGRIGTTYGTDFDCIAESVLEHGYDRAIVITDGYASLDDELSARLAAGSVKILTVLFGGKTDCPEFEPFGEVVQLDDVTGPA